MKKTLKIEEKTHARLVEYGKKGETFDTIINKILDEVGRKQKQ